MNQQGNLTFQAYESFQIEMAVLFGADKDRAAVEMAEVLKFEIAMSNVRIKTAYEDSNFKEKKIFLLAVIVGEVGLFVSLL